MPFPPQGSGGGGVEEGEYSTWTYLRNYDTGGASGANIAEAFVDNDGRMYLGRESMYFYMVDVDGSVTSINAGTSADIPLVYYNITSSPERNQSNGFTPLTGKYVITHKYGANGQPFKVYKKTVLVKSITPQDDLADFGYIRAVLISPNGKYILVIGSSAANNLRWRYALLYVGS